MNYKYHLFIPLHEVLDDKTMMDLGSMWQKHHDRDVNSRFRSKATEQLLDMKQKTKRLESKATKKYKEFQKQLQNAPDITFDPHKKYKPGEIKPKGYYQKALDSLDGRNARNEYGNKYPGYEEDYISRIRRYGGKKLGWEQNPGRDIRKKKDILKTFPYLKWSNYYRYDNGISTMHQRAGERSMAAIGRLTDYLNKNGVNQENPTKQDRSNFERFRQRMSGHPLWKK